MKKYGIVLADNGQQIGFIVADNMDNAIRKFGNKLPKWAYNFRWMYAHIGSAPYIVTDTGIQITAFEY